MIYKPIMHISDPAKRENCGQSGSAITKLMMFFLLVLMLGSAVSCYSEEPPKAAETVAEQPVAEIQDTISVIGVGDIMLGTNYPSVQDLPPNDGRDILAPVHSILQSADLCFGNLEGTFLTGSGTPKQTANPENCYVFKSPDHYVENLSAAGFDVMSIANNHIGDFGTKGKENTVKMLNSVGIRYAGLLEYPKTVFTHGGIRYGFCAFSPNVATVKLNDYPVARKIISELASECDIVIVSFHSGAEGVSHRNITRKTETYVGENRGNPYEFARMAIDAGADILFGHGPHVTRAIDIYKNRFIAYSLGNFATYGRISISGVKGLAPIVQVNVTKTGEFLDAQIYSTKQTGEGGPVPDPENGALKEIMNLTKADFPKSQLLISETGKVVLKGN